MLFFWVLLYGLVYSAADVKNPVWVLPVAMILYTAAFLRWIGKAGYLRQIGMTKEPVLSLGLLPLLALPLCNLMLGGFAFPGWKDGIVLICVSINEELFFRGFLFQYLLGKGQEKAVLGTGLLFSLMHLVNLLGDAGFGYTLCQLIFAFGTGICYCLVILRWGSLLPCIAAHVLTNLTASESTSERFLIPVTVVYTGVYVLYSLWLYHTLKSQKKEIAL